LNEGGWKKDNTAFLFSLDKKSLFKIPSGENAVFHHQSDVPWFAWSLGIAAGDKDGLLN
jgi:hypothetical protein